MEEPLNKLTRAFCLHTTNYPLSRSHTCTGWIWLDIKLYWYTTGKLALVRLNQVWDLMRLCLFFMAHLQEVCLLSFLMQEKDRSKRRITESKVKPIPRITWTQAGLLLSFSGETAQSELLWPGVHQATLKILYINSMLAYQVQDYLSYVMSSLLVHLLDPRVHTHRNTLLSHFLQEDR